MEQIAFPFYAVPYTSPQVAYVRPVDDMLSLVFVTAITGDQIPCILKEDASSITLTPCIIHTGYWEELESRSREWDRKVHRMFVMESMTQSKLGALVDHLMKLSSKPLLYPKAAKERSHSQVSPYGPQGKGGKVLRRNALGGKGKMKRK